jgi:heme/copper-type cytochrome/quinol oxidase subunit 2
MEKNMKNNPTKWIKRAAMLAIVLASVAAMAAPRVIQVTADEDGKFKMPGQKGKPVITLKPGEIIKLKITSVKGTDWEKDGAVHSFTINALKDQGWDLRLKEGTQEFTLAAPSEPGEYLIECLVRCGKTHDDMKMKLVVAP